MTEDELLAQPDDDYMNKSQKAFFHDLLLKQRADLQAHIREAFDNLKAYEPVSDPADIGTKEEQRQGHLRMLERDKKLLDKYDDALQRLARGQYGWCEETGEAIGLRRLLLRPTATLSIDAKERQESLEKHQRQN